MKTLTFALLTLGSTALAQTPTIPAYVDETATSGLTTSYAGDWEYMVGGGVSTFDCSGDGRPEVFLAGGEGPSALYLNTSPTGGALSFEPLVAGVEMTGVTGAYPIDIDSDGLTDLAILRVGENLLMRGSGACFFTRANEGWNFDGGDAWSTAFAATWEDGAFWPTLAVGNYIDRTEDLFPWGSCTDNWLHRPGQAGFAPPVPLTPSFCALSMLFTDWNQSGTPSLRVSNDREYYKGGQEQMWRIAAGAEPALWTEAEGWARLRIWGMGIAARDITGDGYPEYFLTSMADNRLQSLSGLSAEGDLRPAYADLAFARGVTAHRPYIGDDIRPSTAWHAQFEDVNNDRLPDIFVVKGNVAAMPDFALADPNNLLLQQSDGVFLEAGALAGVASTMIGRGGMVVDLNMDGMLDIVVQNRWSGPEVWRNNGPAGGWVQVRLALDAPNVDAIGARVQVRIGGAVQTREISIGGGHMSGHLGWWHFGLGDASTAEVRVNWPDGTEGVWESVTANVFYTLRPGDPSEVWDPDR